MADLMKPRIRVLERRRWVVDFGFDPKSPDGDPIARGASIRQVWDLSAGDWTPDFRWDAFIDGEHVGGGERASMAEAFVSAWAAVVPVPKPLELPTVELQALAERAERGDAKDAAKILRELLRKRTGLAWSVTAGRGRDRFRVFVSAPSGRCLPDGSLRAEHRVLLAAIFASRPSRDGFTVEPHRGHRTNAVFRAAGIEVPDDLEKPGEHLLT